MPDNDLERDLVALGAVLDAPADDHLLTRVHARIDQPRASRRRQVAVLLAALLGIAALSAPVVADWLQVGGVEVRQEPRRSPLRSDSPLRLGKSTTLAAAQRVVGFGLVIPSELGPPDEVWLDRSSPAAVVWLAYRPRPGLPAASTTGYGALLAQARLSVDETLFASKFAEPGTIVEPVELGTGDALWIRGVHQIALLDRRRSVVVDRLRLSDNVLLWERGDVTMRLESTLERDDNLRIARSTPS